MTIFVSSVNALDVLEESNAPVINKVDIEHKNTRQFFANQLKHEREQIFKDFDARGDFYEEIFYNTIRTAVMKLGILWFGVTLFVVFVNNFIRNRIEKKKYGVLKNAIKNDLMMELSPTGYNLPQDDMRLSKLDIFSKKFKGVA